MKKYFLGGFFWVFLIQSAFAQSISNNALPTNPNIASGSGSLEDNDNKVTILGL